MNGSRPEGDPLVSVLMPVYNGEQFIREAIESVQAQTVTDWELLVVDDGSSDSSRGIVEQIAAEDVRVRLFATGESGSGAACARNVGLEVARGRYVGFLDCDDAWLPHKLERQLALLEASGAGLAFGAYERVDETGKTLGAVGVPVCVDYASLLKTNYIGCLTAIYDIQVFGKVPMVVDLACHEDYPLWLRLLRDGGAAVGVREPVARYRVRAGSLSSNKLKTSQQTWRVYRELEGLSLARSAWSFVNQTGRALVRNRVPELARRLGWLHAVEGGVDRGRHGSVRPSQ